MEVKILDATINLTVNLDELTMITNALGRERDPRTYNLYVQFAETTHNLLLNLHK